MAKYVEASPEVEKLFDEVRDKTSIPQWVEFKVLCNNKQKDEPVKIFKANDLVQVLSKGVNFAIIVNEEIFQDLPDDMKELAFDEVLGGVTVSDSDAVSNEKPDFVTRRGVVAKYGGDAVIRYKESVKSLYDVQKQKEDEEKAAKKGKRGRKPKNQ